MSTRIIKDFNGWNRITEASDSSSGFYTGSRSNSADIYTGAAPDSTGSFDNYGPDGNHRSVDHDSSYDSGSSDSDSSDSDSSDTTVPATSDNNRMLSGAKDGNLTVDDIKKIQAVVFGVDLTDTETCDGIVDQTTIDKIKEFRTKYEITEDPNVVPNRTTVGPLTLAKISEIIKTDNDKVEPTQKTDDSSTLSKIAKLIKSLNN